MFLCPPSSFVRFPFVFELRRRLVLASIFIAACAISTGANAQFSLKTGTQGSGLGAVVQTEQVRAELIAHAPDGVDPGKTIWVGLQLDHQAHWHTYWKNAGDSGLPTQLQWTLPAGVSAGDIAWPTPQKIKVGTLANLGYEGKVLLPVPLTITPAFKPDVLAPDLEVKLFASWLVCRQECIPQEGNFVLRIPTRGSMALAGADFDAALAANPKPFGGPATARVSSTNLSFTVRGLPSHWQGKPLSLFPETTEIVETAAIPTTEQANGQSWAGDVWSVALPLSAQRLESPESLPIVLALGKESLATVAKVEGAWPVVAPPATVSPALQAALDANTRNASAPGPGGMSSLLGALVAAMLGGLILNLMPCVFPVLAIKVLGFAKHSGTHRSELRAQGLAYTAGVVLSFLALGGLMLGLRAGGEQLGWGFQLQSPPVIAALALLFTLLGLILVGLLEVGIVLPSRVASLQLSHPLGDAFLTGVLAVAIASPCTAPFMGASLGYAIALPAAQALGIFAALGLGLALPYLAATWVPAVANWLPKPGAWMNTLRTFMAFPMWATVVWLVWVLGHLSGVDGAASLLALLLMVSLVVWSLNLTGTSRKVVASFSIAACALLVWATGQNIFKLEDVPSPNTSLNAAGIPSQGTWHAWTPDRVQAEMARGNAVFVDFTAAWCITCQYNKKTTLANADVMADFAAKRVTLLRADWTRRDPAITRALEALGRSGVPVYVLHQPGKPPVVLSEILSVGELRSALATI
jgi:thiol:disulfide interchange protein DsbD